MFKEFLAKSESLELRAPQLLHIPNNGGVKTIAVNYESVTQDHQLVSLFKKYHAVIFLLKVRGQSVGHFVVLRKFGTKFYWFDPYGLGFDDIKIAKAGNFVEKWVKQHPYEVNNVRLQSSVKDINTCLRHCIVFCYFSNRFRPSQYISFIKEFGGTPDRVVTILTAINTAGVSAKDLLK